MQVIGVLLAGVYVVCAVQALETQSGNAPVFAGAAVMFALLSVLR